MSIGGMRFHSITASSNSLYKSPEVPQFRQKIRISWPIILHPVEFPHTGQGLSRRCPFGPKRNCSCSLFIEAKLISIQEVFPGAFLRIIPGGAETTPITFHHIPCCLVFFHGVGAVTPTATLCTAWVIPFDFFIFLCHFTLPLFG